MSACSAARRSVSTRARSITRSRTPCAFGRQGEIRDRTTEGQHYRIAGLNLLTAIIVYWNTLHLGHAVEARRREGLDTPDHLLAHISPLGWAHILLTGQYLWPKDTGA
jgi:hypothetical protein